MQGTGTGPSLEGLHDVVLPEPVAWTPQTAGWWVLLGITVLLLGWGAMRAARRRRADRYRRRALARLARIETALADPDTRSGAAVQLPVLVKRAALARWPREQVASLSSEAWLAFLDASLGSRAFTTGPGRLLPRLAYAAPSGGEAISAEELGELVRLIRRWIREHRAPAPREAHARA